VETSSGILLAIDGEKHTESAIQWALDLASVINCELTAVHVRDPYLKQFFNDIYAQGREEYLDHVDKCLVIRGEEAVSSFESAAAKAGVRHRTVILDGDPVEKIRSELCSHKYHLLILGRKENTGLAAWRSRNLPSKLTNALKDMPVLVVPESCGLRKQKLPQ